MPYQPALPFFSFFVAVGLVPAVYFLFDDGIPNNHVSKIDNSEFKVPGANVTHLDEDENDFDDEDVETAEGRDVLVMIIGSFCRMCLSGEIKFCLLFFFGVILILGFLFFRY